MTDFLLYLYAESPVHTGAAGSLDVLDLPVQREAATKYPVIWGQSLKGALREAAETGSWDKNQVAEVFGSAIEDPGEEGGTTAGTLAVGDAQFVAMPVPALRHTFAWVTTDIALGRLARKYKALGSAETPDIPQARSGDGLAASDRWTQAASEVLGPCLVALGDSASEPLTRWADRIASDALAADEAFRPFAGKLRQDLLLVTGDVAAELLRECTEQAVRVQLNDTKTVENGPFYSEYLPAETIMAARLTLDGAGDTDRNRQALRGLLHEQLLQVGGDETIGKGLMWGRLPEVVRG